LWLSKLCQVAVVAARPTKSGRAWKSVAAGSADAVPHNADGIKKEEVQQQEPPAPVLDKRSWSVGAELHSIGKCKPCAFNWKQGGCIHGAGCARCHLCDENAYRLGGQKPNRAKRKHNKKEGAPVAEPAQVAIPLNAAQAKVLAHCHPLESEPVQVLRKARGRVLANDVVAPRDIPQASTSTVDGYAVCSADFEGQSFATFSLRRLRSDGAAGAEPQSDRANLGKLEAAYITTGGLLPPRADAVRPQKEATVAVGTGGTGDTVQLTCCEEGKWVRWPGSDMKAGATILPAGHLLSSMDLSALAASGLAHPGSQSVCVHRRPKVAEWDDF